MWSKAAAEWPVSASGMSAKQAPKKAHASTALESLPTAARRTAATTIAEMRFIRSSSRSQTTGSICPMRSGLVSGSPARSAKVSTTRASRHASHTAPEIIATRAALARRRVRVVSGTTKAATKRKPTVSAAATSCTAVSTGMPQRTTAPGSPAS